MQTTNTVLMIEPIAFGFNAETAQNNYFQIKQNEDTVQEKALIEFNNFVKKLQEKNITVISVKDTPTPHTPDSIFPNNWVSFSHDGIVTLYPMCATNRRVERRTDIIEKIKNLGYLVNEVRDLSHYESDGKFLEGTGSIIFDHDNKLAYGSVSLRLNATIFKDFCATINYTPVIFHSFQSVNNQRLPIYHTNVMMCVADKFVVICLDCIDAKNERIHVVKTIENSGKEIIEISEAQMHQFAGNMLQVHNDKQETFLVMSQSAYTSLTEQQIEKINQYSEILYSDLETIETNGGGSARCMLAEVFLPKH